MTRHIILFLFAILLGSCYDDPVSQNGETVSSDQYPHKSWRKIQNIEFANVKGTDTIPWVNISDPDTTTIIEARTNILSSKRVKLHIDYPLNVTVTFILKSEHGFSRLDLIKIISEKYHKIYKEEDAERIANSHTKYGLCCHDITDLDLGSIEVYTDNEGITNILLAVES
ncbi:MAG TPA: hypothetical protein VK622_00690 [Puia sp.]|nr:hypothetical protein [Puia sp.]